MVATNLATDAEGTRLLNLTFMQRLDPAVEDVLVTAAHVTLYVFRADLNQWTPKDVDGAMFVVKRSSQPRFQFIVVNTRSNNNLVENLLSNFEYELHPPYLLYRNATQEVNGIWFYNQHDGEAVASLFGRILNAYAKVPPKPKASSAQSEFAVLKAVPTPAAVDGPLEPPLSSITGLSNVPDESFANFTGAASVGNVPRAPMTGRAHQPAEFVASTHIPLITPSAARTYQMTPPLGSSSVPPLPLHTNAHASQSTNLVTPAFFMHPSSSSTSLVQKASSFMPRAPPAHPTSASNGRPAYGTPLLQPIPLLTPASLTPAHNARPVISRVKVKDVVRRLVQSDDFIDLVYRELQNVRI